MQTPRNILLVISAITAGGAERVATTLANAWADRGDSVTLVVTFSGRTPLFYKVSSRVRLLYLSDVAQCTGRSIVAYWKRFRALRGLFQSSAPDVVLSFLVRGNVAVLLATLGLGYSVIVSERIYPPNFPIGRMWDLLRRFTYPRATRVVMQTLQGLRWLESHIPKAVGAVIPNPVTYPLVSTEPVVRPDDILPRDAELLLAAGRLVADKQFDVLVESFAPLARRYSTWMLVILGEGQERRRLEKQVAVLGLADRVIMPGQAGNMNDWYRRATLYVSASRLEGFPNTILEALAHGCPTVSYDCPTGPSDIIGHGTNGLLVTPVGDVTAMTEALDRLIRDDRERQEMAARAVEVRDRYSINTVLEMWDDLFASACQARQDA